jgi:hypothetical protein
MEPDPIFAAIEVHRMAHVAQMGFLAAVEHGPNRPDRREAEDRIRAGIAAAAWTLLEFMPTTSAGVLVLAAYACEFGEAGNEWPDGWRLWLQSLIVRAAARRRREKVETAS